MQDVFASKYPLLWATLMAVKSEQPAPAAASRAEVDAELSVACEEGGSFPELLGDTVGELLPTDALVRLSLNLYHRLGLSEQAREFLGRLWADAAVRWDGEGRTVFLSLLIRDRHEVFETLDIAVELFRCLQFSADEVFPWIEEAHKRVADDLYQKGFWGCVEAFCSTSPDAAILVCERWLATRPPSPNLHVISNMIGWLRVLGQRVGVSSEGFLRLEESVKIRGYPAWRAVFIQSWIHGSNGSPITEEDALSLRDHYVVPDSAEETAWCMLLNSVVHRDRAAWHWAHRELMSIARSTLGQDSKHWIGVAALHGIKHAHDTDTGSAERWRDMFRLVLPLSVGAPLWYAVHDTLKSLASKNGAEMREVVKLLATHSARSWLEELRTRDFKWFFPVVKEKTPATAIATELCFGDGSGTRQVGLLFFDECGLEKLDPSAVQNAAPVQIELLLLEAQRRQISFAALARLHASLTDRVDKIQAHLPELFYDEVALQCMNTNEYRAALINAQPENVYLQAIVTDTRERLAASIGASRSPAFRMQAPGQARAQILHGRRFVQDVSAGIKQRSTVLSLLPSVHMLYGGHEPRIFRREGELSPPVQMHSSSSSVEIPRLEFVDPEGMTLRRISAAVRLKMLGTETER